jgi:hypothetical protein
MAGAARIDLILAEDEKQAHQVGGHGGAREEYQSQRVARGIAPRQKRKLRQTQTGPYASQRTTRNIGVLLKAQDGALSRFFVTV